MWLTSHILIPLVFCMEFALLVNGSSNSENILSRYSQWDCLTDVECTANGTSCVSGYCECSSGYFLNSDMTECLRRAIAYGDACSEKDQCSSYLLAGGTCENSVCVCGDGYHYIHGRCYPSSGLGEACDADINCYVNADTEALSCVNGTCVCSEGFYQREYRTCRRIGYAVGDECAIDLDCRFENSYCTTSFVCAVSLDSSTTSAEITVEENDRIEDSQLVDRSVEVPVGTLCTSDGDCSDLGNSSCGTNGTCICNSGYYASDDLTTCLPVAETLCTSDGDCSDLGNSSCGTNGTCVCNSGYYASDDLKTCLPVAETLCTSDGDCSDLGNSSCGTNGTCVCNSGYYASDDLKTCLPAVGTLCTSDGDCSDLGNSRCGPDGTCICNRGYYASADLSSCLTAIGEECGANDTVVIRNSLCRDGTWSCGYSTVASLNQQICRKSTKSYNFSCVYNEQCYIFGPDASCQRKRCLCNTRSHWLEDQLFCWTNKGIGESCLDTEDCYVEGLALDLSCTNSVCTCPPGTVPTTDRTGCQDIEAVLDGSCEFDANCTIANSVCVDSTCRCAPNYDDVDGACLPGLNATCSIDSDCTVPSSICSETNVCECGNNTVAAETNLCKPVADYGEECEYDIQCSSVVENTYCSRLSDSNQTTACACESGYDYRNGGCQFKSSLGSSCSSILHCYLETGQENVVCRNGKCACDWSSTATSLTSCEIVRGDATTIFFSTSLGLILLAIKILMV